MKNLFLSIVCLLVLFLTGCSSDDTAIVPPVAQSPMTWKIVSNGGRQTLAIRSDGTLWAWGGNQYGQLGNGNYLDSGIPQQIGSESNWKAVDCGLDHAIALKTNGTIWAWGRNNLRQLGNGSVATSINHPVQIGTATDWETIVAHNNHAVAIKQNGSLWHWGNYNYNEFFLLDDPQPNIAAPVQLPGSGFKAASASDASNLLLKADGTLWGNGRSFHHELGLSATFTHDETLLFYPQPIQIGAAGDWKSLASGNRFSLALKTDGTMWGWGLDLRHSDGTFSMTPRQMGTYTDWIQVTAGLDHGLGLKTDGTLWGWGSNMEGQLADATLPNIITHPAQIGDDNDWESVHSKYNSSFAIKSDGTLWAWGLNSNGQLGNATTTNSFIPILIPCPQ